jgi:hypothetical protein
VKYDRFWRWLALALVIGVGAGMSMMLAPGGALRAEEAKKPAGPPAGAPTDKDPEAYKGLSKEQIDRVRNGEILILDKPEKVEGRQMINAAFVFNQDLDTTWNLLTTRSRQEEYLPRLDRSLPVGKTDKGDIIEIHVKILTMDIIYRTVGTADKAKYQSSWKLDPTFKNDMKEVSGFFHFYWIDDKHTLARYGTWVETGIGIPSSVQEYLIKRDLPESLAAQKKWVDSNGTYRKPDYKPPAK